MTTEIETFTDFNEAVIWMEEKMADFWSEGYDNLKGEIELINNQWRVGVSGYEPEYQGEFHFE